jgi:hypothetical protein
VLLCLALAAAEHVERHWQRQADQAATLRHFEALIEREEITKTHLLRDLRKVSTGGSRR